MGWLDQYQQAAKAQELANYQRVYYKVCPLYSHRNDIDKCQAKLLKLMFDKINELTNNNN